MHEKLFGALTFAGSVLLSVPPAWAQNYPTKPIHLIVAQAAGSTTDSTARVIAQKLADALGLFRSSNGREVCHQNDDGGEVHE